MLSQLRRKLDLTYEVLSDDVVFDILTRLPLILWRAWFYLISADMEPERNPGAATGAPNCYSLWFFPKCQLLPLVQEDFKINTFKRFYTCFIGRNCQAELNSHGV
ncbi:hypothetical protein CMV_019600 [Castanea mollissima]|uniref:Uncharacterized protein n=1 Tax=Castanea mollissima TaxID=60419 RepID=A0A8J4VNI1_9ROSI|nr:hypothetical protein CMV_019600 [Castanea mollissima]